MRDVCGLSPEPHQVAESQQALGGVSPGKVSVMYEKKEAQSQQAWRAAEAAAEAAAQQTEATARTKTAAAGPGERERKSAKRSEKRETTTIKMRGPKKAIVRP